MTGPQVERAEAHVIPEAMMVEMEKVSEAYAKAVKDCVQRHFATQTRQTRTQAFFSVMISNAISSGIYALRRQFERDQVATFQDMIAGVGTGVALGVRLDTLGSQEVEAKVVHMLMESMGVGSHMAHLHTSGPPSGKADA